MEYAVCTVAAAPVRSEVAPRSEMVHQLLFGETVAIIGGGEGWFKLKDTLDGYEGWVSASYSAKTVCELREAAIGDPAFFTNEKGRIVPVGILLSGKEIIHASGKVRIDPIGATGIINKDSKQRTHTLNFIRRYF